MAEDQSDTLMGQVLSRLYESHPNLNAAAFRHFWKELGPVFMAPPDDITRLLKICELNIAHFRMLLNMIEDDSTGKLLVGFEEIKRELDGYQ